MSAIKMSGLIDAHDALGRQDSTAEMVDVGTTQNEVAPSASDCTTWSDLQLVFAESASREAAFAEIIARHSQSMTAVARMVLGADHASCDDVLAEVFAALWFAPQRFDPSRGSLRGYLRLWVRGRAIDLVRSDTSRYRRERNDETGISVCASVDLQLVAAESSASLRQAVSRLPAVERTAIELAYFGSMSYRQVASYLELPEGTIKSRIRSGLQRLRHEVDVEDGPTVSSLKSADSDPRVVLARSRTANA